MSANRDEVMAEIRALLVRNFCISEEDITPDATLKSLDLDSIDFIDLISELERNRKLRFAPNDFAGVKTIDNVVSILSGGNMDVITMSSLIQHGLINRGRIFTFSVQLPDRPGELLHVAEIIARENGNIIKLEHNQFVNINRQSGVELKVTLEAFGLIHKHSILEALKSEGFDAHEVGTADFYD